MLTKNNLSVLCSPILAVRVRARIQEVEGEQTQERFFRPYFLQAPGDLLAHEGRLCRLDCKVGSRSGHVIQSAKYCITVNHFCLLGEWTAQPRTNVVGQWEASLSRSYP